MIEEYQRLQHLVTEAGLDHVGLASGIEMSRLAHSAMGRYRLLENCVLFGTLITDLDGIYDPNHYNDHLLLKLQGVMREPKAA
jgi:hypothetical protein